MARATGSIGLTDPNPRFGDVLTIVWEISAGVPWAYLHVEQDGRLVCQGWTRLDISPHLNLGPSPSWSGPPGSAAVDLVVWNTRTQGFGKPIASYSFEVTA
jgi:hypothetical protein